MISLFIIATAARAQSVDYTPEGYVRREEGCTYSVLTPIQPHGGLAPDEPTPVRLLHEDVHLELLHDEAHLRTRVRYTVSHSGPEVARVRVRVPFAAHVPAGVAPAPAREVPAVHLVVGEQEVACVPSDAHGIEGCGAELLIPPGETEVTLDYQSLIVREDSSHSAWQERARRVSFPLGSDGWASTPEEAHVTLDRGPWRGLARFAAHGATRHGNLLMWDARRPWSIQVQIDAPRRLWWARTLAPPIGDDWIQTATATATSTLGAGGRYAAGLAVDRDPATAWCEGVEGPGIGEGLELRFPARADAGLAVLGGYARNDATWVGNNRLKRIAVEICDDPSTRVEFDLTVADERLGGVSALHFSRYERLALPLREAGQAAAESGGRVDEAAESCLRVTVVEVEPGTRWDDTCISEIRPFHWEPH